MPVMGKVILVKQGPAVVRIYEQVVRKPGQKDRTLFRVRWTRPNGGETGISRANLEEAKREARIQATQLAQGIDAAQFATAADLRELQAARKICARHGRNLTLLGALEEWSQARSLTGANLLLAANAYARSRPVDERITLRDCVDRFIAAKTAAGQQAERVYRSKLTAAINGLGGEVAIADIRSTDITRWLDCARVRLKQRKKESTDDFARRVKQAPPIHTNSRNDYCKRLGTMFRWAQRAGYLPREQRLEIEYVDPSKPKPTEIGIITPEALKKILSWLRQNHPHLLACTVLAAFCGIRSDELHGKRSVKGQARSVMPRQRWRDIKLDEEHPRVIPSIVKENTPSWRSVDLPPAAIRWLRLCPRNEAQDPARDYICAAGAMERVRHLVQKHNVASLPDNCFRHSFITYAVALTEDKAKVAIQAGTSPEIIDRHYRRGDVSRATAKHWFEVSPNIGKADRRKQE